MSCCGQRRAQLKARLQAQQQQQQEVAAWEGRGAIRPTKLRYRSGISVVVTGPVTGRAYVFAAGGAPLEVDADDAQAMLDTGRFEPVELS